MRLLAVDPGRHGCGCSLWNGTIMERAWFCRAAVELPDAGPARWAAVASALVERDIGLDAVVLETMRVYTQGKSDPADLFELQGLVGAIAGVSVERYPGIRIAGYDARAWKGQVPRDVMGARMERWVRDLGWSGRVEVPSRKTWLNDVMHAVGLGRHATGAR